MQLIIDQFCVNFCASGIEEYLALFSTWQNTNEGLSVKKLQRLSYERIQIKSISTILTSSETMYLLVPG